MRTRRTILPWDVLDFIAHYPDNDGAGGGGTDGTVVKKEPVEEPPPPLDLQRQSKPPEQKYSRADLDLAASTAKGEERERVRGRHANELAAKDEEIARLKSQIADQDEVIRGFDEDTRAEYVRLKETLPPLLSPFAPSDDAPIGEVRSFLSKMKAITPDGQEPPTSPVPPPPPANPLGPTPPPSLERGNGHTTIQDEVAAVRHERGRRF